MSRRVLVLSHFAVQQGGPGNTRHVEMFDRLPGAWDYTIVAADRKNLTRHTRTDGSGKMRTVPTPPFNGNGASRVFNWVSYTVGAFGVGVTRRDIDVVYGSTPHLLTGLAAWMIARIRRVPFVLEVRDLWPRVFVDMGRLSPSSVTYWALRSLERFLYRHADEIVVLAKGSEQAVRTVVPEASISFIPNGSDPAMWETDEDRDDLRAAFGFEGSIAVYAGAHGPANGLNAILEAAEDLEDTDVTFVLVGGGIDKMRLVNRARTRGLDNVRFLDPVPKQELARLFAAADVGLHVLADVPVFRYGVSPNKLFDYMAAGLPLITNCPGEVGELVTEVQAGVTCEPNGLAEAVKSMIVADDAQRRQWGRNGKAFIVRERSRDVLSADLLVVLERVTGDR